MSTEAFTHDVFLSHSSKDKAVVRAIAERLKADGLRVWFDEWEIRPGDSIPAKIEDGLEHCRVLVLCISAHAFGSDWAQLEAGTFRFRDPLNKERRFIPLRFDAAPIKGSIAQFLYVNWLPEEREQEYEKLLEACRPPAKPPATETQAAGEQFEELNIQLHSPGTIVVFAFSPDGTRVLTGGIDHSVRLWDGETGRCLHLFEGHENTVESVAWSADQRRALSGSWDGTVRVWDIETGRCLRATKRQGDSQVWSVAWSGDHRRALSGEGEARLRLWDVETGHCLQVLESLSGGVESVAWSADQRHVLAGGGDNAVHLWDLDSGRCVRMLEGHTQKVESVAWSADQRYALSASDDKTVRVWDVETGRCLRVIEGHTGKVYSVAWSPDHRCAVSGSRDKTVRLWDVETGLCLRVLEGHTHAVQSVAWSADQRRAFSGDAGGGIRVWNLSEFATKTRAAEGPATALSPAPEQVQYTNAKVLLVGESGAGKTGLTERLAHDTFTPSYSTSGTWSTQWQLKDLPPEPGWEREVWLWDFGGQADQRLIHQLYVDRTALLLLVFNADRDAVLPGLREWQQALSRSVPDSTRTYLVAGRIDVGFRFDREKVSSFAQQHGYRYFETSANDGRGCPELRRAIQTGIPWTQLERRTSPTIFKLIRTRF
jgi:small GTP-binding protein